ncbi:MAG TPA: protein translocase subunit SecF [Ruminiclostridium sp.]|nr:protein translocase subunit SecF [Ruminiclostridium sp.]
MKKFDFIESRKYFFIFTILLFVFFAVMAIINGVTLDINFKGGTRLSVEITGEADPNVAGILVEEAIGKKASASIMETYSADAGAESTKMLRIDIAGNEPLTPEEEDKVKEVLTSNFNVNLNSNKNENVSIQPSIGREALNKGILAVMISVVLILFYVAWRFSILSGFPAAICAIIALIHDVGVMFGVYIIFKLPLNDIFIATVLTVIGYSMNDTVIIYDRIRENTGIMRKSDLRSIVNVSIYESLTRTIHTMMTTLICVAVLLIFSVNHNISSLVDFSFSLLIGVISGAYSTLFIATQLWVLWKERKMKAAIKKA